MHACSNCSNNFIGKDKDTVMKKIIVSVIGLSIVILLLLQNRTSKHLYMCGNLFGAIVTNAGDNVLATQPRRIAVIGAGLAGLSFGHELKKHNFGSFVIYEGRAERVGGRVMTCTFIDALGNERYAELGAESFFDAGKDVPASRALIQEMGLEVYEVHNPDITVNYFDGEKIVDIAKEVAPYNLSKDTLWEHLKQLAESATTVDAVLQMLFGENMALRHYFNMRMACYEGGQSTALSSWHIDSLCRFLLDKIYSTQPELHDIEFRNFLGIKGGNSVLANGLAQELDGHIQLDHRVTSIIKNAQQEYVITFANGKHAIADIVVLTMPCTVYEDIAFASDVISQETLQVIKKVQYGKNSKIITPIMQKINHVYCNEYATLYQAKQSNVLSIFYCDERSYFTQDTIASIYAQTVPFIYAILPHPEYIAQPVIAQDRDMCTYSSAVGHSWMTDPYAKGSYSFIAPGQEAVLGAMSEVAGEKVRTAFAPLNNNTLFFAGEHTTVFLDTLGTMEAAIESGTRTGITIMKLYGPSKSVSQESSNTCLIS